MQDKESDGSSKKLMEIVARAIREAVSQPDTLEGRAEKVLTAIKEAGYEIVELNPKGLPNGGPEWKAAMEELKAAMITAGEE